MTGGKTLSKASGPTTNTSKWPLKCWCKELLLSHAAHLCIKLMREESRSASSRPTSALWESESSVPAPFFFFFFSSAKCTERISHSKLAQFSELPLTMYYKKTLFWLPKILTLLSYTWDGDCKRKKKQRKQKKSGSHLNSDSYICNIKVSGYRSDRGLNCEDRASCNSTILHLNFFF